jgi:tetratricopeptide (TPR) repeat protein
MLISIHESGRKMKAYIISSSVLEKETVKQLLTKYKIEYFDPHIAISPMQSWSDVFQKAIIEADLIIAVFNSKSSNILFELGYCYALKKKIFLILPPDENIPPQFNNIFFIQAQPNEFNKIEYAFFAFITANFPRNDIALLSYLAADKNASEAAIELSKIYQQQKKWKEAEDILLEIMHLDPENLQARTELSKSYQQQKRWKEAEDVLLETLRIDPLQLYTHMELSRVYQQQRKWKEAEDTLLLSLRIGPDNLHARTELNKIYQQQKKWKEAEDILLEVIRLDPDNLQARTELSKIYQQQKKWKEAEDILLELLRIDPEQLYPRMELSKIYQRLDRYNQAEEMLLELLSLFPHYSKVKSELSKLYIHQGNFVEAERILKHGINQDAERKLTQYKIDKISRTKSLLQQLSDKRNYQMFEEAMRGLFEVLDIHIAIENKAKKAGYQPDFSLWIDNITETIGNPVLVETKIGHLSEHQIKQTVHYLSEYLKDSNAKAGILLYKDLDGGDFDNYSSLNPLIIILSLDELLDKLVKINFSDILVNIVRRKQQVI